MLCKKTDKILVGFCLFLSLLTGCSKNMDTSQKETQTASGLKFIVVQQGTDGAKKPSKGQRVTVHYTGWLEEDGQLGHKFDSSVDRGMPFSFVIGIGQVIKGWDEGVMGMQIGEKRRLTIPSKLGYGDAGFPGAIPGGATLIFDVELIDAA